LVVSVDGFFLDFLEGTGRLAGNTLAVLDVFGVIGVDRLLDVTTGLTLEEDDFELVEDLRSDGDDSSNYELSKKRILLMSFPKCTNLSSLM
jgi:hypothetical protein